MVRVWLKLTIRTRRHRQLISSPGHQYCATPGSIQDSDVGFTANAGYAPDEGGVKERMLGCWDTGAVQAVGETVGIQNCGKDEHASFLPQWLDSPEWTLTFSRSLFQVIFLLASLL
ncbi:hypothetical protein TNCV_1825961 [Trichonephila clavipes]|nr:hypothetical protein TNCV_1825961 [Trichonephila clavipes]